MKQSKIKVMESVIRDSNFYEYLRNKFCIFKSRCHATEHHKTVKEKENRIESSTIKNMLSALSPKLKLIKGIKQRSKLNRVPDSIKIKREMSRIQRIREIRNCSIHKALENFSQINACKNLSNSIAVGDLNLEIDSDGNSQNNQNFKCVSKLKTYDLQFDRVHR
mmetsp:Transcript_34114/g.39349  ORF Transcript_34114/g.39349 Transcript_34114/m.39349 type:complete len:164 (-) Transcript_34114:241-732(-)